MYADESQLNSIIMRQSDHSTALHDLMLCIQDIISWNVSNMLRCTWNPKKTEIIHFSRFSPADSVTTIKVGDYSVIPRNRVKDFGDKLDCHLTFKIHINNICCSASHSMHHIRKIKNSPSRSATERCLINAFVSSILSFCSTILHGLPSNELNKLQRSS